MSNIFGGITRSSSFFRKEILEVLRQPRLLTTMIIGPFLILLIFGVGYRASSRNLRTLFVTQPDSALTAQGVQQYSQSMDSLLVFSGATSDLNDALEKLQRGEVDLVVVEPQDAAETIKDNQQAVYTLYHREIDPAQVSYIDYLGWLYVSTLNQQVVRSYAVQGQADAVDLHTSLAEARQNVADMRQAVQSGDEALARQKQQGLSGNVSAISLAVGAVMDMIGSRKAGDASEQGGADPVKAALADLKQNTNELESGTGNKNDQLSRLENIDRDITNLDNMLAEFQNIDPSILVSPFRSESKNIANTQPSMSAFFAPAVLALLLQHLAVTFAALSIIRERNLGTMQLLRVSPVSAGEALFGKYVSFMLFGGVVAAALAALLVYLLHVPMLGSWLYFGVVVAAVLFTSLGIGFVISLISQTDSQAVQYSMIVLLASVFFSGFIMSLDMLWQPVQVISWMLPTTYGTLMLRDIALRGSDPAWLLVGGLVAFGLVLMFIAWRLMHRLISSPQ